MKKDVRTAIGVYIIYRLATEGGGTGWWPHNRVVANDKSLEHVILGEAEYEWKGPWSEHYEGIESSKRQISIEPATNPLAGYVDLEDNARFYLTTFPSKYGLLKIHWAIEPQ